MANVLEFPERDEVVTAALTWPERAKQAAVIDASSYQAAADLLKGIKALRQKIAETFDPHIARAFQAHRALTKEKNDAEAPLTAAERVIKEALVGYDQAQERLRRIEEARLREEARLAEEQRVIEQAAAMETEGQECGDEALVAEAHELISQPIQAPPIAPVARATPKVAGITMRKVWRYRVVNANVIPRQYLKVDEPKIASVVRALGRDAKIPGIEVYEEQTVAAGSR